MTLGEQIVEAGLRLIDTGVTDGTTGNVSARRGNEFLITPTSRDYRLLTAEDLVTVALDTGEWRGRWKPSSEWRLHAEIYRVRPDVNAVIHHHATWCSAVAAARKTIPVLVDEAAEIGPISTAAYAPSASPELAAAAAEVLGRGANAVLLANHGAVAVGQSIAEALRRALEIERLAQMFVAATVLGGAHPLPAEAVERGRQFFAGYRAGQHELVSPLRPAVAIAGDVRLHDLMSYSFRAGITFVSLLRMLVLGRLSR